MRSGYKRKRFLRLKLLIIFVCLLLVFTICFTGVRLRPIITNYGNARANVIVNQIVNEIVYKNLQHNDDLYNNIVTVTYRSENIVSTIQIDTVAVNSLKSKIISDIQSAAADFGEYTIKVPMGTLSGNEYLIGFGPKISIKLTIANTVKSNIKSSFSAAGINQTLHQIMLQVDTCVHMQLPWFNTSTALSNSFIVAETVIVGIVPEAYTNVERDLSVGDIEGDIMDYAALVE